jgi:RNA polymerase sigma factor (sigma-70 family)
MPRSSAIPLSDPDAPEGESRDRVPAEVARLLVAGPGAAADYAWEAFVARYSGLLLKVSFTFAPGYDGALDRYAFMLDELRRSDCRRLRAFAADGRGRFSTWLAVVARRLCLDHYRRQHGRFRAAVPGGSRRSLVQAARRGLSQLDGGERDPSQLPAPWPVDPADGMDERDRREALRRAVERLSPGDQLLLRLRFEQELTAREMAAVLGLPSPFHVYRRLEAVFRLVRTHLAGGSPAARSLVLDGERLRRGPNRQPPRAKPSAKLRRAAEGRK